MVYLPINNFWLILIEHLFITAFTDKGNSFILLVHPRHWNALSVITYICDRMLIFKISG